MESNNWKSVYALGTNKERINLMRVRKKDQIDHIGEMKILKENDIIQFTFDENQKSLEIS